MPKLTEVALLESPQRYDPNVGRRPPLPRLALGLGRQHPSGSEPSGHSHARMVSELVGGQVGWRLVPPVVHKVARKKMIIGGSTGIRGSHGQVLMPILLTPNPHGLGFRPEAPAVTGQETFQEVRGSILENSRDLVRV